MLNIAALLLRDHFKFRIIDWYLFR